MICEEKNGTLIVPNGDLNSIFCFIQGLRTLVQNCLVEAQQKKGESIAFPAIGTGNLGFPRERVARLFYEEISNFSQQNLATTLKVVRLVVHDKDNLSIKAFQAEERKRLTTATSSTTPSESKLASERKPRKLRKPSAPDEKVKVKVVKGDITSETTDCIAFVTEKSLDMEGGLGAVISKAAGPTVKKECLELGDQNPGTVVSTSAGKLKCKRIYHMVESPRSFIKNVYPVQDDVLECLRRADADGMKSMSLPAVGTGNKKVDPEAAANAMISALTKFSNDQPKSLKSVRVVVFQPSLYACFEDAVNKFQLAKGKKPRTFMSYIPFLGSTENEDEVNDKDDLVVSLWTEDLSLVVLARSQTDLKNATHAVEVMMSEECMHTEINHEAIGKLSKRQIQLIRRFEIEHGVNVDIETKINRIYIRGRPEDVPTVKASIYEVLLQKVEDSHIQEAAEMLAKSVRWYYTNDESQMEPYDDLINYEIEKAYEQKWPTVTFTMDGITYKIDFPSMCETDISDELQTTVQVLRRDLRTYNKA